MHGEQTLPPVIGNHHWSQLDQQITGPTREKRTHTDAMMISDAHLLAAFRAGDESAFSTLAERYRFAITAACERQAPPGEIDDCIQAVFLVLARRPAAAARAPVLLAWLHRVAHYVCRDARRGAHRRKQMISAAAQPTPVGNAPEAAVLEQLDAALLRLEERQRAAVLLHASGNKNDDIAKLLGVTAANASKLVQRGLLALREYLYRGGAPISAAILLTFLTSKHATAATTIPLTISALSSASLNANVSLLAKGTLMHLTMTSTSTWIITALLAATICAGGVVAAETLTTPQPAVTHNEKPTPVPSPIVKTAEAEVDELREKLNRKVTFSFENIDALEVFHFLQGASELNIIIDTNVVRAGIAPVTLNVQNVSVQSALNLLMTMMDIRYVQVDDAIFITQLPKDNKDWFEKTEKLLSDAEVVGAASETEWGKNILSNLDRKTTFEFKDADIQDVISFFRQATNSNVVLDPKVIAQGALPVNLQAKNMKLRHAFNHLMRVTNLTYKLRDESIFITIK